MRLINHEAKKVKLKEENINRLVLNFVNDALLPFSIVENPSFKQLMCAGFPRTAIMDRKQLTTELVRDFEAMKMELKETFQSISHICITADIWTIYHR